MFLKMLVPKLNFEQSEMTKMKLNVTSIQKSGLNGIKNHRTKIKIIIKTAFF